MSEGTLDAEPEGFQHSAEVLRLQRYFRRCWDDFNQAIVGGGGPLARNCGGRLIAVGLKYAEALRREKLSTDKGYTAQPGAGVGRV